MPDSDIVPFRVAFDPGAIDDLRARLRNTRWLERETVDDWSQGTPIAFVQDLARYWCDDYDFGAAQERMNAWPQFTTRIDDLDIHFVHARSPEPDAVPLVITHGWPGSVVEFFDVLGPLTDPVAHGGDAADAFHVVCPSMPGYGFSDRPSTRGRGVPWMANAWATLMSRLGYERFGAQGGDWGSAVTSTVGADAPGPRPRHPREHADGAARPARRRRDRRASARTSRRSSGTRAGAPATRSSSPPGPRPWATASSTRRSGSWRGSSRSSGQWTDCDGDPLNIFTRDQLLDNVTVYWFTGTGASSGRLYWESAGPAPPVDPAAMAALIGPVTVPTGCSVFPHEIRRPSRRQAEQRYTNIHWWNEPAEGRPLRRVRAAGAVRRRGEVLVPSVAMSAAHESRPVTRSEAGELLAGANGRQR